MLPKTVSKRKLALLSWYSVSFEISLKVKKRRGKWKMQRQGYQGGSHLQVKKIRNRRKNKRREDSVNV